MDEDTVKYTTDDIMKFLMTRTKQVDDNLKDIKTGIRQNSNEVRNLKAELEDLKRMSEKNQKTMGDKIRQLEEQVKKTKIKNTMIEKDKERNEYEKEIVEIHPDRRFEEEALTEDPLANTNEKTKCTKPKYKSDWAREVAQQLVDAANAADKIPCDDKPCREKGVTIRDGIVDKVKDRERKKTTKGMKALKRWFGEETPENSSESEQEPSEEEDWEEKVGRKERNRERRRRNLMNRKMRKETTATKAMKIIGLGPIEKKSIDTFMKDTKNYREAKEKAVREYLSFYLQFDEEDLTNTTIVDTQVSSSPDKIIYVAFESQETIKEIHWRAAEVKNERLNIRNFIPPQFWDRYMFLSRACKDYRERYPSVKTQMRFNDKDIEIMMKERGSAEPYKQVSYSEVADPTTIPEFDYSVRWFQKTDRPPHKEMRSSHQEDCPPSLRERERSLI